MPRGRKPGDGRGRLGGGRKKGQVSKSTKTIREWLTELLQMSKKELTAEFKKLDAREKFMLIEKFLPYITPKMQAVQAQSEVTVKADALEMSEEEIIKELERLRILQEND